MLDFVRRTAQFLPRLLPNPCILCFTNHHTVHPLCASCIAGLPWIERACIRCGLPLSANRTTEICGPCLIAPLPFDAVKALFEYKWPCDKFIFQIKFAKKLELVNLLADLMAQHFQTDPENRPTCLIPVPLHLNRLKERGFNQAHVLAKRLGQQLNIPVIWDKVKKHKETKAQSQLSAQGRLANLTGAFEVSPDFPSQYKSKVAIIDDVVTTGETAGALAKALKAAGVSMVEVWCCCRTPKDKKAAAHKSEYTIL